MPRLPKRQPRVPISVSLLHPDWVRAQRSAGMLGQTLSEYGRAAILAQNDATLGPRKLPASEAGSTEAAA